MSDYKPKRGERVLVECDLEAVLIELLLTATVHDGKLEEARVICPRVADLLEALAIVDRWELAEHNGDISIEATAYREDIDRYRKLRAARDECSAIGDTPEHAPARLAESLAHVITRLREDAEEGQPEETGPMEKPPDLKHIPRKPRPWWYR